MAWQQIQNPTLTANIGETLYLPTKLYAVNVEPDRTISGFYDVLVNNWKNTDGQIVSKAKTDKEGEFMYYGEVSGYAGAIYCSVVVGNIDENPESSFPTDIEYSDDSDIPDEFGVPKQEVRTADFPNIDSYQYLKSKKNRTTYESAQLQKLTELMASKIIMARDINFIRNSVINTQSYCLSLKKRFDECVTDAENIGSGEGEVYSGYYQNRSLFGKTLEFRTLRAGDNIEIETDSEEIVITAIVPEPPPQTETTTDFCALDPIKARSFQTCSMHVKPDGYGSTGAWYRFGDSKYLGIKAQYVGTSGEAYSMLHVFGYGNGEQDMTNAGRIVKGKMDFVIEMKTGSNSYSGIHIVGAREDGTSGKVIPYENDSKSRVDLAIQNERIEVDGSGRPSDGLIYEDFRSVYTPYVALET